MKKEQKEKEDKFYEFCMKNHTCNGCPRETICFPEDKNKWRKNENYKSKKLLRGILCQTKELKRL
jgi:hypothetical protein